MGERLTLKAFEIIDQGDRKLVQIDFWYESQGKGGRIFCELNNFFKMAGADLIEEAKKFDPKS